MPISRLFRLLYILLERERVPAPELAQTLEVSVRTIYRDVQTLGEAGIPVYAERGRDGGVAILPTFRLNKSMVSAAEKQICSPLCRRSLPPAHPTGRRWAN